MQWGWFENCKVLLHESEKGKEIGILLSACGLFIFFIFKMSDFQDMIGRKRKNKKETIPKPKKGK
jgi:hypothetical protein